MHGCTCLSTLPATVSERITCRLPVMPASALQPIKTTKIRKLQIALYRALKRGKTDEPMPMLKP